MLGTLEPSWKYCPCSCAARRWRISCWRSPR